MAFDRGRLKKELTELTRDTKSGVTVEVKSSDMMELEGVITGPEGTPYEGGARPRRNRRRGRFAVDPVLPRHVPDRHHDPVGLPLRAAEDAFHDEGYVTSFDNPTAQNYHRHAAKNR